MHGGRTTQLWDAEVKEERFGKTIALFRCTQILLYPDRVVAPFARLDLATIRNLEFLPVDQRRFPAVTLAYEALRTGGSMPAVLNAANEIAVERFLAGELPFVSIVDIVSRVLERHAGSVAPIQSVDDALHWDGWARNEARGIDVAMRSR